MFFFAILLILLRAKTGIIRRNGHHSAKWASFGRKQNKTKQFLEHHCFSFVIHLMYIYKQRYIRTSAIVILIKAMIEYNECGCYDWMYSNRLDMIGFFHGVGQWVIWCNMVSKYPASLLDWILTCTTLAGGFAGKWCWNHRFLQVRDALPWKTIVQEQQHQPRRLRRLFACSCTGNSWWRQGDYSTTGKDWTNDNVDKKKTKTPIFWYLYHPFVEQCVKIVDPITLPTWSHVQFVGMSMGISPAARGLKQRSHLM